MEFGGVPFSMGEKRTLDCQHGRQYFKPRQTQNKRLCLQGTKASEFLMQESRQIHPIMGDGNCLICSLSYLLFGNEDNHQQIRQLLVEFVTVNSHVLVKYCFSRSTEEHVGRMKYETVFGT